mmetsp:Transcript_4030/g.7071  ORF Transcript_4030/g.7071 Transcript_4030/m.7071 type:complete len:344 (+) Transcript_4030:198-1229(+)
MRESRLGLRWADATMKALMVLFAVSMATGEAQVVEDCPGEVFACPNGTKAKAACPKATENCACIYECPRETVLVGEQACALSFEDCACENETYVKFKSRCEPPCASNYSCPANSIKRGNVFCAEDFKHCKCEEGFAKDANRTKCISCDFKCPENSLPYTGSKCVASMNDCKCDAGFEKLGDSCIPCVHSYTCPEGSSPRPGVCVKSFRQCSCDSVQDPLNSNKTLTFVKQNGECVPCRQDFACPKYAQRLPGRRCYDSTNDCVCGIGLTMMRGACVPCRDFVCPSNSQPKPSVTCTQSFSDCSCKDFYQKVNGTCTQCALDDTVTCTTNTTATLTRTCKTKCV